MKCALIFAMLLSLLPATADAMKFGGGVPCGVSASRSQPSYANSGIAVYAPASAVVQPHRLSTGALAPRALQNEFVTNNWSGYAVTSFNTGQIYCSASGTFKVPTTTYGPGGDSTNIEYVSWWVGVGGYCQNSGCSSVDPTLIQLGVANETFNPSPTIYYPWYEMLPAGPLRIPFNVAAGDVVSASLQCIGTCLPSSSQTWVLSMTDQTASWQWSQTFQYQTGMGSAEWITEAPSGTGVEPLADYTQVSFEPVSANGVNPNLVLSDDGIVMQNPNGQTSNPSAPVGGNQFSTCWGFTTLTSCTFAPF